MSRAATDATLRIAPRPRADHRAGGRVRQDEHRGDHDRERGLLARQVAADEPLVEPEARVVDQQADRALVGRAGARRRARRRRGPTGRRRAPRPGCPRRPRAAPARRVQPFLVAGHQDDVVLGRGQLPGELQAEARGRAGDECGSHGHHPTDAFGRRARASPSAEAPSSSARSGLSRACGRSGPGVGGGNVGCARDGRVGWRRAGLAARRRAAVRPVLRRRRRPSSRRPAPSPRAGVAGLVATARASPAPRHPARRRAGPLDPRRRVAAAAEVLHDVWGYDAFRGEQAEIVETVVRGGDALVLMPTGGGKSLCYQVPSLVRRGHRASSSRR